MGIGRSHIPYRNSSMTLLLRDSLGGNCRTVMIANVSVEQRQLDESISTCRFAQRVAMISNKVDPLCILSLGMSQAVINEELDPALVILRLQQEIRDLKEEIRMLRGEKIEPTEEELQERKEVFRRAVIAYCKDDSDRHLELNQGLQVIRYGTQIQSLSF